MMPNCPFCKSPISPGTKLCRSCGASIPEPATLTADLEREVRSLLDQGKKIEAVKVYEDHTGCGLKDAKDAVEALQCGASLPHSTEDHHHLEVEVLRLLRKAKSQRTRAKPKCQP